MDSSTGSVRAERLLRELARLHDVLHALFRPRPNPGSAGAGTDMEVLSSRQAQALYLIQSRPTTMTEMANLLRLSPAAATPVADRLVELRMARRVRDPADRRLVYLATTKRGHDLIRDGNVWEQTGLTVLAAVLESEAPGLEEQCAEGLVRMVEAAVDALAEVRPTGDQIPGQKPPLDRPSDTNTGSKS
ncbi:MAG TPA: MarR family transcriptional regulator [Candidatus Dormibacteraeota bacterium]|nr:MarR family transcriptional regulator [Candidatus Dormibacteraeota bacterium]